MHNVSAVAPKVKCIRTILCSRGEACRNPEKVAIALCTSKCNALCMANTKEGLAPALTLGQRLYLARDILNRTRRSEGKRSLSIEQFAEEVGVHRNTITRYEKDLGTPSKGDLMLWASVCDVDFKWLAGLDLCAPSDSNREPADSRSDSTHLLVNA